MASDEITLSAAALLGMRVLIVEDTLPVAQALQLLLEDIGATVVGPVSTPAAAERLLSTQSPHLALVDVHLGEETSHALMKRLRDAGVPVVAISGSAHLPTKSPSVAALQKPFSGRELLTALCQLAAAVPVVF